jgi:hypothetical protein
MVKCRELVSEIYVVGGGGGSGADGGGGGVFVVLGWVGVKRAAEGTRQEQGQSLKATYRLPIHAAIITQSSGGANRAACQRPAIAGSGAFPSLSSGPCSPQVSVAASDAQKHVERSARE